MSNNTFDLLVDLYKKLGSAQKLTGQEDLYAKEALIKARQAIWSALLEIEKERAAFKLRRQLEGSGDE
jgi:hypothetical protein